MKTIYENDEYSYVFDKLQGVGRFIRKSDGAVSLMDTGADAREMFEFVTQLRDLTTGELRDTEFNKEAKRSTWCED